METLIFGLDWSGSLNYGKNTDDFDKVIGVIKVEMTVGKPMSDSPVIGYYSSIHRLCEIVCSNNAEAINAYFLDGVSEADVIAML